MIPIGTIDGVFHNCKPSSTLYDFVRTITSWEKDTDPDSEWITDSVLPYTQSQGQTRITAACEDVSKKSSPYCSLFAEWFHQYRAGATIDVDDDRDQGIDPSTTPKVLFRIPVLSLASMHLCRRFEVEKIWSSLTEIGKHQFYQIGGEESGHFIVNERTEETAKRLSDWLGEHWH